MYSKFKIFAFSLSCLITTNLLFAQEDPILMTIGNMNVSLAEFERVYNKNNTNLYNEEDRKSPKEYLQLFIDYKLKVLEAKELKLDTNRAFINELNGYRKELAAPYLTDVSFNEKMIRETYDRMTSEVNASHILLRVPPNSSAEEEQKVFDQIMAIKKEIDSGLDFNDAAANLSEDPSAVNNKGRLNYFSAFQMVAPFENAAFNTPVGEVSEPVRSSFGYHLIKVHDKRPNKGEIKVAHIMKAFPQNASPAVKENLKKDIYEIYDKLKNGASFEDLAKSFSDDKRSADNGGEMPWFSSGRMIKEFAEPAFALSNVGDYSEPVETPFGWHIIKKLDQRGIKSFDELKGEIENRIKKDPERSRRSKTVFIDKLKKEYNYKENIDAVDLLKKTSIGEPVAEMELFVLNGKSYSSSLLQDFIGKQENLSGLYFKAFESWVEEEITNYEDSRLEEKHPDFRFLMKEYHDGILLFNISEEKIWNYAAKDSAGLTEFFLMNKKNHLWGERFKGSLITCKDVMTREEADKYFAAGMFNDEVTGILNKEEERITIEEGAWEKGTNPVVDYYVWNGDAPENFNSEITFVRGDIVESQPKSLDDARGLYISDYQNYLEEKWIKKLRKKYKIKVNKKLLKEL